MNVDKYLKEKEEKTRKIFNKIDYHSKRFDKIAQEILDAF